jgi:hypothetical protein
LLGYLLVAEGIDPGSVAAPDESRMVAESNQQKAPASN